MTMSDSIDCSQSGKIILKDRKIFSTLRKLKYCWRKSSRHNPEADWLISTINLHLSRIFGDCSHEHDRLRKLGNGRDIRRVMGILYLPYFPSNTKFFMFFESKEKPSWNWDANCVMSKEKWNFLVPPLEMKRTIESKKKSWKNFPTEFICVRLFRL